jgi:UDPglucose 6-dehydrogenase
LQPTSPSNEKNVSVVRHAYIATKDADGVCILTEWDEFKKLDFQKIYDDIKNSTFVFDGRNILECDKLLQIGFIIYSIGKTLRSMA